ncbi:unnamed protein product [Tilletia controversa]|nr:unnamed protein product [Tilletia controversa]
MPPRARKSAASSVASSSSSSKSKPSSAASNKKAAGGRGSSASKASAPSSKSRPTAAAKGRNSNGRSKQTPIYVEESDEQSDDVDDGQDDSADDFQIVDDKDDELDPDEEEEEEAAISDDDTNYGSSKKKGKSTPLKRKATSAPSSTNKKRKTATEDDDDDDDDDGFDDDEDDPKADRKSYGFVKAGIAAPTTGHVPPNQVSPHLFNLLRDLKDPAKNDREWFKARDKLWRYCEKTWLDFIETLTENIMEKGDDTIPFLPPKDINYRIYRDVRFSASKVPYKTEVQATFSRAGRKGNWAGYHLSVSPGGRTYVAGGKWSPNKEELGRIRQNILDDSALGKELKQVVSAKEFVKMFGKPVKNTADIEEGKRQNIWGFSDQLKIAPKIPGLKPDHKDMHWLRLRSFVASHYFTDEEVLSAGFQDRVCEVVRTMRPLTSVLNRMVFGEDVDGPVGGGEEGAEAEAEEEEELEEEEEEEEEEEDGGD